MRNAYLYYDVSIDIDYDILLRLYNIAEYDVSTNTYSIIRYKSISSLANLINISKSKLDRFFNSHILHNYMLLDKKNREIIILNNFRGTKNVSYVVLSSTELNYLISNKDNLFIRYYLYIKYYCGKSRSKSIDTTAKQFLESIGYCASSNNNISKLSAYNSTLVKDGFISIDRYIDEYGHRRNRYTVKYFPYYS